MLPSPSKQPRVLGAFPLPAVQPPARSAAGGVPRGLHEGVLPRVPLVRVHVVRREGRVVRASSTATFKKGADGSAQRAQLAAELFYLLLFPALISLSRITKFLKNEDEIVVPLAGETIRGV